MNTVVYVFSQACRTRTNLDVYHRLSRLGFSVCVFVPGSHTSSGRYGKVDVRATKSWFSHPRLHSSLAFTLSVLRFKPDAVILEQDLISLNVLLLGILRLATGTNLIVQTYQNIDPRSHLSLKRSISYAYHLLYLLFAKLVDTILTVSFDSFSYFNAIAPNKVRLIHLGVNRSHFRPISRSSRIAQRLIDEASRERYKVVANSGKAIGYAGRIVPEKGISKIIRLLAECPKEYYILIEKLNPANSYDARLISLIHVLGLSERIIFFRSDHSSMHLVYSLFDYVVLPSISVDNWIEQYGRVPVEASMCGLVPILSDSGHLRDLAIAKISHAEAAPLRYTDLNKSQHIRHYCSSNLDTRSMASRLAMIVLEKT